VICLKLGIKQTIAPKFQASRKMHKGNFAGITRARKHAFSEERTGERDTIEPANYLIATPDLDRMAMSKIEEFAIQCADTFVYPGALASGAWFGAAVNDRLEIIIDSYYEFFLSEGTSKTPGHMNGVEWQDAPVFRFNPIESAVFSTFSHGKNATRIGFEKHLRGDVDHDVVN
jgi:hypothetical protein